MPMEYGMLESVEETFRGAGMRLEDFDAKAGSAWSGGGLRRRLKALGLTDLYEPYFRVHSSSVHGNWYELYGHHLHTQPDGGFLPKLDFEDALQAPLLFTAVDFLCGAGAAYLTTAAPPSDDRDALEGRVAFCGQKRQVITDMYRRLRQGGTSAQAEAP
jgi:hypothetical protein